MAKKTKRKASAAQLRALAKGRKTLKAKRTKKPHRKAVGMEGKKPRKKTAHKPRSQVVIVEGKHKKRRHSTRMHGLPDTKAITNAAQDIGLTMAGAILGSILIGKMPIKNPKLKAALPTIAGIILSPMVKQPILKHLLNGIAIGGGINLVKQFAPQLGLAGMIDDIQQGEQTGLEGEQDLQIEAGLRKEIEGMIANQPISGLLEQEGDMVNQSGLDYEGEDIEGDDLLGADTEVYQTAGNL